MDNVTFSSAVMSPSAEVYQTIFISIGWFNLLEKDCS